MGEANRRQKKEAAQTSITAAGHGMLRLWQALP